MIFSKKSLIITLALLIIIAGGLYAAPKVSAFLGAKQERQEARQAAIGSLSSIYKNFSETGFSYYNKGMDHYKAGDVQESLIYFDKTEISLGSAEDSLTQLSNSYANPDSDVALALTNLQNAVADCRKANVSAVEAIRGVSDISIANQYSGQCASEKDNVASFLKGK